MPTLPKVKYKCKFNQKEGKEMTGIKMTIDAKEIERANKPLDGIDGGPQKALYNAIKRGQAKVRTETTRAISGTYAITQQNTRILNGFR